MRASSVHFTNLPKLNEPLNMINSGGKKRSLACQFLGGECSKEENV